MSVSDDDCLLRAVTKLQAKYRGWAFRADVQHEILLNYTGYDPQFDKRLLLFVESRKMRKLRFVQIVYREYRQRKRRRMQAKVLSNCLFRYCFFFRKKVQWVQANIGKHLLVSSSHMKELQDAFAYFKNGPFQTEMLPNIFKYGKRNSFYKMPAEQNISAWKSKTPTVMAYANSYYRDKLYRVRFRQPVYGRRKTQNRSGHSVAKHSVFTRSGNIFKSKMIAMIDVSCAIESADTATQLTKLFYVLRRSMEIFTVNQVLFDAAAVSLQRHWRGTYCRLKMLPLLITNIVEKRCAVLLQRWWRNLAGIKKRFRILSTILAAVRKIDSPVLYIDALTFYQLLQTKHLPLICHSVASYPEFCGVPIVNLNGQVIFKRFRRSVCSDCVKKRTRGSDPTDPFDNTTEPKFSSRSIPKWISLFKLALESRYNTKSYDGGAVRDADGIGQLKSSFAREAKAHHSSYLHRSFSQEKILFNLLTNGCSIGMQLFSLVFERKATKGVKKLDDVPVMRLEFPSILEARCRCAMLMLATMDTMKEECVCLLTHADMASRVRRISVLSDTLPKGIFQRLTETHRRAKPGCFGECSASSGVASIVDTLNIKRDRQSNRSIHSLVGDAAIVLHMEAQIPMYIYYDLFSMGLLVDDDSIGPISTCIVGKDLTPVPILRPLRDPLECVLRLSGWPRTASTPSWLRREKRSGEDVVKFTFFLETLKVHLSRDNADDDCSVLDAHDDDLVNSAIVRAAPQSESRLGRAGSGSLRSSSMYKNKNATDSTGIAYWGAWEQEIATASLNGVKPSSPNIVVNISRGNSAAGAMPASTGISSPDTDGILGVFPTNPPAPVQREIVTTDKILFVRSADIASGDRKLIADRMIEDAAATADAADSSALNWTGFETAAETHALEPGSPRWLRRHLWAIPRVLMWCADGLDDRVMTGYAELQREKRRSTGGNFYEEKQIDAGGGLDIIETVQRATQALSPRNMTKRATTASTRLDILQHVRNKLKFQGQGLSTELSATRSTAQSPRPHSPFFRDHADIYSISNQVFTGDGALLTQSARPQTAAARLNTKNTKHPSENMENLESSMPNEISPIVGSNENIRSGKEEFVRSRQADARQLRQSLDISRNVTQLDMQSKLEEKRAKIQEVKDKITELDLPGRLSKKKDDLAKSHRAEKREFEKKIELLSEAKLSEEQQSRQRIQERREVTSARSKHRLNVVKNSVTLCALSKYSKVSQLKEHKERERQKILQKNCNIRCAKDGRQGDLLNENEAAAMALAQATGFQFDESSITDSIDSNELLKGILYASDCRRDSIGERCRRDSAASSKFVTEVLIQQSELSKTVESLDSILSRSSNGRK